MSTDPLADLAASLPGVTAVPAAPLPIAPDDAVIVVGSQAFNEADRSLPRADVRPLQILTAATTISGGRFDPVGVRGLRDFLPLHDGVHALVTTANDLVLHNLVTREQATWPVSELADIHTLTPVDGGVLVASTATDEVWEIGLDGNVRNKISLAPLRHRAARPIAHDRVLGGALGGARADTPAVETTDHFHVNEAIEGPDGHRYGLVHHVEGFRPMVHAANRLVGHGSGGIVDLTTMETHPLELVAPHSPRPTTAGYAVLDSGRNRAVLTDRRWQPTGEVTLSGWGRGFAMSADASTWFIGISATRRRYLRVGQRPTPNGLAAVVGGREVAFRVVEGVEQIWSVHRVTSAFARLLIESLSPA